MPASKARAARRPRPRGTRLVRPRAALLVVAAVLLGAWLCAAVFLAAGAILTQRVCIDAAHCARSSDPLLGAAARALGWGLVASGPVAAVVVHHRLRRLRTHRVLARALLRPLTQRR